MFARIKRSGRNGSTYEYLQIVESHRERGKVRQRVLATLGRRDRLLPNGALDSLLESLARFSERLRVVEKVRSDGVQAHCARSWGPALVFERLWEEQGLPEIICRLGRGRKFEFDLERVSFALSLQRLVAPGSDLAGSGWVQAVECRSFEGIRLHHLYRTVGGFLGPMREELERELFWRDRDLFSLQVDLLFIDTTSTFVYRPTESRLRRRGYSRDRRPDQPKVVLCVAVNQDGWPVAWDILPGNTTDHSAFERMVSRLRRRFEIRRVIVVADRGMISEGSIGLLAGHRQAPYEYILGCRMRRQKEVSEEVVARGGRYREAAPIQLRGRRHRTAVSPSERNQEAESS